MRVLLTGGTSLLGAATARALAQRGDAVTVLQRRPAGLGLPEILADIADLAAVRAAVRGQDAVVHLAAKVGVTGAWRDYHRTNVTGTAVILDACRAAGVSRLVHVSSPSVAHTGHALVGVGAEPADPDRARGAYARTKAAAERLALGANDGQLAVAAIRPHLVWGRGDTQLIDRVVARAKTGRLVLVGSGAALVDTTYVGNAAEALVAALDRTPAIGGQALVVTNGEPRPIGELLHRICAAAGVPGPRRRVPKALAYAAGGLNEAVWAVRDRVRPLTAPNPGGTPPEPLGSGDPPLTRFLIEQLSTAHWFDQRHTRAALKWSPRISLDEGFAALAASFRRS
jgi:nucleoside-diphosphate-sugar epimerase